VSNEIEYVLELTAKEAELLSVALFRGILFGDAAKDTVAGVANRVYGTLRRAGVTDACLSPIKRIDYTRLVRFSDEMSE
jgi:hypothetical protein